MQIPGTSRTRAVVVATAAAALVVSTPSLAGARAVDDSKLTPHTHFTVQPLNPDGTTPAPPAHGAAIPNIDSVKATIRAYYGADSKGIANQETSPYITEMKAIEANILANMPTAPAPNLAVVFDADDTTLMTYDMEDGAMHFNFDLTLQDQEWVQKQKFPATPGMVDFVKAVEAKGYHVYGITGRTNNQRAATLGNLDKVGYTEFNEGNFYTKWNSTDTPPSYVDCTADGNASKCSTVEYKAFTRKHIEETDNVKIVLNIGDQFSDLQGGYSLHTFKLPNPTYYLPSLNIAGAPASDTDLTPRTEFTMAADGTSGTSEGGEGIPNIDNVKAEIRAYYGATNGIANKTESPYISEMSAFSNQWVAKLRTSCEKGVRKGIKPAVVFDADDTTLWTYDMEDGAMKFNFDPTVQNNEWVIPEKFIPVPGMRRVVRAAAAHGCTVVGITGRRKAQRAATIDNLNNFYDDVFKTKYYFTKWDKGGEIPTYVTCAATNPDCTTIEYKSQTRKHVQDDLGFHIIANFGDQFSDLIGGSSDRAVKLPNPTYYLP